jgi:hypothetical protein
MISLIHKLNHLHRFFFYYDLFSVGETFFYQVLFYTDFLIFCSFLEGLFFELDFFLYFYLTTFFLFLNLLASPLFFLLIFFYNFFMLDIHNINRRIHEDLVFFLFILFIYEGFEFMLENFYLHRQFF